MGSQPTKDGESPPAILPRPPYWLTRDIYRGGVLGDYAPDMGRVGIVTMIILGYFPVIGTLCGIRDYLANRQRGDNLGAALCALSVIPVLGGFFKTAEVVRSIRIIRSAYKVGRYMGTFYTDTHHNHTGTITGTHGSEFNDMTGELRGSHPEFSVFHPKMVAVERWYSLIVYIHVQSALGAIRIDAARLRGEISGTQREVNRLATRPVPRGTSIKMVTMPLIHQALH